VRAAEANGALVGCFDIQIAGCAGGGGLGNLASVRTVTGIDGSGNISFSGAGCSWAKGAMVHVPWSGAAPDVGAIEFFQGIAPPRLISVTPGA
jgi:hypothetical protein